MSPLSFSRYLKNRRVRGIIARLSRSKDWSYTPALETRSSKRFPQHVADLLLGCDTERTLSRLQQVGPVARAFVTGITSMPWLGVLTPSETGRYGSESWWYLVYRCDKTTNGCIAARVNPYGAEDGSLRGVPAPYWEVLRFFDDIAFLEEASGFIGPRRGLYSDGFLDTLGWIRESRTAIRAVGPLGQEDAIESGRAVMESLLPVVADGMGNYFLVDRETPAGRLYFFYHETGCILPTEWELSQYLSAFWSNPREFLYGRYPWGQDSSR